MQNKVLYASGVVVFLQHALHCSENLAHQISIEQSFIFCQWDLNRLMGPNTGQCLVSSHLNLQIPDENTTLLQTAQLASCVVAVWVAMKAGQP